MICCCTGMKTWEREGDMGIIYCEQCGSWFFIPQCCNDEKCGGCTE